MADGSIDIDVNLNQEPAQQQAQQLGQQLGEKIDREVSSAAKDTGTALKSAVSDIGADVEKMGKSYTVGVTAPIVAAATAAGAAAVNIDTALTGVKKTVDGTEQDYENLKNAAIEFSKTNAVDPAQILDIQALGAQLGYDIDELQEFGEVVSGLDIATNMDAETAATQLAQFANIMGMSHDETRNFGSTIVDLGNNFATTEADISNMAMRIAGAGKQIGLSEADVLGLSTALASMGINAEAGGTAISTIMANIDKEVANGKAQIEEFGIEALSEVDGLVAWADAANMSAEEFIQAWGDDAVGALSQLLVGLDQATQEGGNMSIMLSELGIDTIRQTDTFKRLASNSSFLGEAIETANNAWRENTALDKEVENRNNSLAAQFDMLKNRVMAVAIEVGEPLMESLTDVIDAGQPLIDMLASGAAAFSDLDADGQRAVLMAIGAAAAFGPLTTVMGKLMKTTTGVSRWQAFSNHLQAVKAGAAQASTSLSAQAKLMSQYRTVMIAGQQATVKYNQATGQVTVVQSALTNATKAQSVAMSTNTARMTAMAAATNVAKVAARGLGSAFLSIAPIAVFSLLVAGISALATQTDEAREKAEKFDKATGELEAAAMGASNAVSKEAQSMDDLANGVSAVDFDEFLDKHSRLIDSVKESNTSVQASTGLLEDYGRTINDSLAKGAEISESEVAYLKLAIDGVNKAAGTNYQVVQDAAGAYHIMADGAEVAVSSINELIDTQIRQAQLDAVKSSYEQYYQQAIEDSQALIEKESEVNALKERQAELNERMAQLTADDYQTGAAQAIVDEYNNLTQSVESAENELAQMQETQGKTQSGANRLQEQMNLLQQSMDANASEIVKFVAGNVELEAAIQSTGESLTDVVKYMEDTGLSVADLSGIFEREGVDGIRRYVDGMRQGANEAGAAGRDVAHAGADGANQPEEFRQSGQNDANATADGVDSAQDRVRSAFANLALAGAEGANDPGAYNQAGADNASAYEQGVASNQSSVESSAEGVGEGAVSGLEDGSQGSEQVGRELVNGVGRGIADGSAGVIEQARNFAQNLVDAMKSKLDIRSPSRVAEKQIGKNFALGVANGVKNNKKYAKKSASEMADLIVSAANKALSRKKKYLDIDAKSEAAYWKQIRKTVKKGTEAYKDATANYLAARKAIYDERLSNAEKALSNRKRYLDTSAAYEIKYWKKIRSQLKKGTAAYKEANLKILELQADSKKQLSSAKSDYRSRLKEIKADLKKDLADAKKEYDDDVADIREKRDKDLQDLTDSYNEAVKSRAQSILGSFDLFERFTAKKTTTSAEYLLENLKEQVAATNEYSAAMQRLKSRIGEGSLYDEIAEKGIDALRDIRGLNAMTDKELREFVALYNQRNKEANSQAVRDNQEYLREINQQKAEVQAEADREIASVTKTYNETVKSIRKQAVADVKAANKELADSTKNLGISAANSVNKMAKNIKVATDSIEKDIDKALNKLNKLNNAQKKVTTTKKTTTSTKKTTTSSKAKTAASTASKARSVSNDAAVFRAYSVASPQSVQAIVNSSSDSATRYVPQNNETTNYNDMTQSITIQGDVNSPDEIARKLRLYKLYELEGGNRH